MPTKYPEDAAINDTGVRFMRLPAVEQMTGLKKHTIYELMRRGLFPRPVKIGPRAGAWKAGELIAWLSSRPSADYPRAA